MAWRLDSKQPRPIPVEDGDRSFTLLHKRLNGYEKVAALEAITAGIIAIQRGSGDATAFGLSAITGILWRKVVGWEGVQTADGLAKPFHTEKDGVTRSHLDEVMGDVPLKAIVRAVFLQLAANGITMRSEVRELFAEVVDEAGFKESLASEIEVFLSKADETAEPCSSTCATPETVTPS